MTAAELLAELRKLDVSVALDGDRLRLDAPAGVLTDEHKRDLAQRKPEVVAFLREAQRLAVQQRAIVPLQVTGTRAPIFAVAGHNGDVFAYRALVQHLAPDQPFFGLQPAGLEEGSVPLTSVEDMARYFAAQIRAFRPTGPMSIAGYCAGGTVAFELARTRRNKVTSSEKRNVMKSGVLWNEVITALHKRDYADVELEHQLADSLAMQLVRWPKQFDVIVTDNLFGDLLSDLAAMLTGSLGMLPSASLGAPMKNGRPKALYEPVHGSAPDIAGQGKANPIACILSFAMALRYSFDMGEDATRVEQAVEKVLAQGLRTADLMGPEGGKPVSTGQMGDAIIAALDASL